MTRKIHIFDTTLRDSQRITDDYFYYLDIHFITQQQNTYELHYH